MNNETPETFEKVLNGIRENDCGGYSCNHETADNYYLIGDSELKDLTTALEAAKREAIQASAAIVVRRTEIPKEAKNPTRDGVVILGEEIAGLILAQLSHRNQPKQEGGGDAA